MTVEIIHSQMRRVTSKNVMFTMSKHRANWTSYLLRLHHVDGGGSRVRVTSRGGWYKMSVVDLVWFMIAVIQHACHSNVVFYVF